MENVLDRLINMEKKRKAEMHTLYDVAQLQVGGEIASFPGPFCFVGGIWEQG